MNAIEFLEQTCIIAKDQPQYLPLPAHIDNGRVTFCWKFNWKERVKLLLNGKLWHTVLTFNKPLQSQLLQVDKPDLSS